MDAARMRELLTRLSCPLCGGTHGDTVLVVIDSPGEGGGASIRAQCVRCHLFWAFSLDTPRLPAGTGGRRRPPAGPITVDELIELHSVLRDFEGSFEELWEHAG